MSESDRHAAHVAAAGDDEGGVGKAGAAAKHAAYRARALADFLEAYAGHLDDPSRQHEVSEMASFIEFKMDRLRATLADSDRLRHEGGGDTEDLSDGATQAARHAGRPSRGAGGMTGANPGAADSAAEGVEEGTARHVAHYPLSAVAAAFAGGALGGWLAGRLVARRSKTRLYAPGEEGPRRAGADKGNKEAVLNWEDEGGSVLAAEGEAVRGEQIPRPDAGLRRVRARIHMDRRRAGVLPRYEVRRPAQALRGLPAGKTGAAG